MYTGFRIQVKFIAFGDRWMQLTGKLSTRTHALSMCSFSMTTCEGEMIEILLQSGMVDMNFSKESAINI